MTLRDYIKAGIQKAGIQSYEHLSNLSGVPLSTIKAYMSPKRMHAHKPNIAMIKKLSSVIDLSDFIAQYLSDNTQESISKQDSAKNQEQIVIPFYRDCNASAGFGSINHDTEIEQITISKVFLRLSFGLVEFNDLSIITCDGNSMMPTLSDGDFLIIKQDESIKEDSIYILEYNGELFVKRIQKYPRIRLISDNKDYLPIEIKDQEEIRIIAKVVGSIRRYK